MHADIGAMRRGSPDEICAAIASTQWGLINLCQALAAGLTLRQITARLASGKWERGAPRVYRLAGAPPSREQDEWCAYLWARGEGALALGTAARGWGFRGFEDDRVKHRGDPEREAPRAAVRCPSLRSRLPHACNSTGGSAGNHNPSDGHGSTRTKGSTRSVDAGSVVDRPEVQPRRLLVPPRRPGDARAPGQSPAEGAPGSQVTAPPE